MPKLSILVVAGMTLATPALAGSKLVPVTGPDGKTAVLVPPMAGSEPHTAQPAYLAGPITAIYDGSSVAGMTCDLIEIGNAGPWLAIPLSTNHGFALALGSIMSQGLPFGAQPGDVLTCGFSSGGWYQATGNYVGTPH